MVYGRYIMIYLYLLWFINQQTSLGGHHLVPNHKPINLAKALVFPTASHEQNASSQHPIIPNDRLQEQPRPIRSAIKGPGKPMGNPWETHGKPMEKHIGVQNNM